MKIGRILSFVLVLSFLVFTGCAKKQNLNKDSGGSFQKEIVQDDAQYKKLYRPPDGGSPENVGKILFASNPHETPNADYDLFSIDPDGKNIKQLTAIGKFVNHPVWSPEYSRIAFSAHVDEHNADKIFIMTADGSEKRQLTFGESQDKFPTWSPDGKQIAYISYRDDIPNLFVMDVYGKNEKQLTFGEGEDTVLWPSWSPIDNVIAFTFNKGKEGEGKENIGARLRVVKPDGTGLQEIISPEEKNLSDYEPAWSPDGKTLYFLSNRSHHIEIWKLDYEKWSNIILENGLFNKESINLKKITNLYSAGIGPNHRPRVSPDGKKLVFYGGGTDWVNFGTNLYTINVDGTGVTNITKSTSNDEWPDWQNHFKINSYANII